ncbi:MAG TPA: serine/threonine-protein kinase [Polyangiaceae bacterium]|nr:serine/threonine-protein kinase [Polyangiaceae bacterium]
MERIGEYLVRRLLGEGGMGKVFEAEERLSKRRVALKLLKPELAKSEEGRRLFLNEMSILSRLDHPNVVRCLACSEVDGQLVMTLEYLEGKTLRQELTERGPLPWSEAVAITVQVAKALAAAHRGDPPIIHRDLKPENIMVLGDGAIKVMDFGIAKVLEAMHKTTTQSVGTLQYMSPEQIDATGVDARSDLYCLGLIFYEMLKGSPPFDSASPRQLLNQQCTELPPPLPDAVRRSLPRGVERLVMELLEKLPERRPVSAEAVLRELEPFAPAGDGRAVALPEPRALGGDAADQGSAARTLDTGPPRGPVAPSRTPLRVKDTIDLLDRPRPGREVPGRLAWLAIVGLSLVAGVITYFARSQEPRAEPSTTTASVEQRLADD